MQSTSSVREQILSTASELFYREGVQSVGVDTIIARAGVAKSSLYRHFRTKDELIAAYVQAQDEAFWMRWDAIAAEHDDPRDVLLAQLTWIGNKIATPGYRGCPQLNIAAEVADPTHPARKVGANHKAELRRRLAELADGIGTSDPASTADQLWLLVDGAFANHDLIAGRDPVALLIGAATSILAGAATDRDPRARRVRGRGSTQAKGTRA